MVTLPAPSRPASWADGGTALTDSSPSTYRFDKVNLSGQPVDRGQLLLEMAIEVTILAGETQVPLLPQVSVNDIVSQSIEVLSVPLPPPPPALPPPSTTKPADPVAAHEPVARPTSSAAATTTATLSYDAVRPRLRSLSTAPTQGPRPPALPRSTTSLLHPPLPSVSPFRPISTSPTLQRPALSIMETLAPKSLDTFDADPPAVSSTTSTGSVPRTPTGDRRRGSTVGGMAGTATARRACNCDHSGGRRRPIPDAFLSLRRNVGTRSPMVGAGRATPSDDKPTHHQHGDDCPLRDLPEEEASLAMESPPADSLRRAVTAYLTLDEETQTLCLYAVDEGRYRAVVRTTIPVRHFGNWLGTDDLPMASASLRNLPALAAGTGHTLTLLLPHSPNTESLDFWLDPGYTQRQMLIPPALAAAGSAPAAMGVRFEFEPTAHLDFGWAPQSRLAECIRFHSQVADPLPSTEPFPGSSAGRASLVTTPTPVTSASGGYGPQGSGEPPGTVRMSSPDTVQLLRSTQPDQPTALTYTSTAEQSAILSVAPHRWRFTAMVFLDYTAVAVDSDDSPASRLSTGTHWEIPCRFVAQDMDQVKLIEVEAQHSRVHWQLSYSTPTAPTVSPSAVGHIFRSPQVNESTSTRLDAPIEAELRLWVDPPPGTGGPGTTVTTTPKRISLILVFEGVYSNDLSLAPSPAGPTAAVSSATSAAPATKPQFHVPRLTLTDVASQIGCLAVSVESPLLIIHELEKKGLYYLNTQDMSQSGSDASDDEDDASWASDASAELSISEVGSTRSQTGLRLSNRTPLKTDPEDPADWDFGGRVDPHRRRTMFRQLDHVRRISLGPRALLAAGAGRASVAVGGGSLLRRLTSAPSAAIHPPPAVANDNDDDTQLTPTKPGPGGDGGTGTMGSDETPVDAGGEVDWSIFSSPRVALGRTMTDEALPLARRANLFGQLAPALALPLENGDDGLARETLQEAAAFRPAAAVIQDLPEPPLIDRPPREADLTLATPDRPVVYRDYGFSESDYALALQINLRPRTQAPLFTANTVTARLTVAPPRREDPASLIRRHRATPRRTPLSSLVPTAANPATGEPHRLVMDLTIQLSVDRDRILHVLPSSTTVAARTGAAPTCSHAGGASHETARWATGSPTPSQPSYLTSSPHARRNFESQWGTGTGAPGPTGSFFEETTPLSTPRPSDVSRDACLRLRFPHLDLDGVGWWVVKVAGRRVPAYVMPHRELWVSLRDYLTALAPTSGLATGSNDGSILSLTHPAAHFDSPRDATRPSYGGDDLTVTVEVKLTTAFQFSDAPSTTQSASHRTPASSARTRRTPDHPPAYTVPLPIFDMPVEHLTAEVSLPSPVADRYTIETALYELSPLDGADYDRRPMPRSPFTSRHYETTMLEPGDAMWLQIYRVLEEPKAAGDVGTLPLTATTPLRGMAGALDLGSPTKPPAAALVDKNVGTDRCAMVDRCTTAELDPPPPPRVRPDTSSVACQANEADDQAARLLVVAQEAVVALDKSHAERVMALQVQVRRTRRTTCAILLTPFILGALSLGGLAVYLHLANDPQLPRPLLDQVLIPAANWVYDQRGELSPPPIFTTNTPEEEGSVDEAKYRAWAERHYVCPAEVPEPEVSPPTEASVIMTVASTTTVPAERVVPPETAKGPEQSDPEPEVNEMTNDEENPLEQVLTAVYGLWQRYYERLHLLLDPQRPM
ncbi:hypothetical protein IWQ60_010927 [Tieghemiomyces parasiticus]|uniref:Uncharacterized protein n=1 Tax=Tieghemiomyces parasiticus TaxID=78921 RepID=A0A9W7ZQ64_9FUNG|nr:hypothetical protein IWQ60_010927 [Tieghemiomyces parasiticus]